jgi:hypothetical protein
MVLIAAQRIMASEVAGSAGQDTAESVTALHLNQDTDLADVTVAGPDGATVLHTTQHHPFWNETRHHWTDAADLRPGDRLHAADGSVQIVLKVVVFTGHQQMRDLTVARLHTYYVVAGGTPVLVHNCPFNMTSIGLGSVQSPAGLVYNPGSVDGHRVRHLLAHGSNKQPDPSKRAHSQLGDSGMELLRTVDEAWANRGTPSNFGDNDVYVVDMGRVIGTGGETHIKIVVEPGSSRFVTAHRVPF